MCWLCKKRLPTKEWQFFSGSKEGVCAHCYDAIEWFNKNRPNLKQEDLARKMAEIYDADEIGPAPVITLPYPFGTKPEAK